MRITKVTARPWTLPLRAPFKIASRTALEAANVAITVHTDDEGITGFGASAPVGYVTGESVDTVLSQVAEAEHSLVGQDIRRLGPIVGPLQSLLVDVPAARAGLEIALYDAWAKSHRVSLWDHFGAAKPSVRTDITIPFTSPAEAEKLVAGYAAVGLTAYKIKVGSAEGPDADIDRIVAIVGAAPNCRLRIDANQAFSPEDAIAFVRRLDRWAEAIDLVEQPVPRHDVEGLVRVRKACALPIFADESICSPQDALTLIAAGAVDGINIKLMKCGVRGALTIATLCKAQGIRLMIGCMLETSLGISAAAILAAGTGDFDYIDLDSHTLLSPVPGLSGGFTEQGDALVVSRDGLGWGCDVPAGIFEGQHERSEDRTASTA